jgi:glutamate 5-kinase
VGVRGDFSPSEPVSIVARDGTELARGLARYGVGEVARMAGAKGPEIVQRVGPHYTGDAVVHRDDLVVL